MRVLIFGFVFFFFHFHIFNIYWKSLYINLKGDFYLKMKTRLSWKIKRKCVFPSASTC